MINKQFSLMGMVLIMVISAFPFCSLVAGGFGISPGSFCLQNMPVGKDTDLGVDLMVFNNGKNKQEFIVKATRPAVSKADRLGYDIIPDPSWVYFKKDKIAVEPGKPGNLRMHLNIPDEAKYYNQHWIVEVTASPVSKGMFQVGISGVYLIETQSKSTIIALPAGKLALVPTVVDFEDYKPGTTVPGHFTIFNNDSVKHEYSLSVAVFHKKPSLQISETPGYQWVDSTKWVALKKDNVSIGPNGSAQVKMDVTVPKDKSYRDQGWEAIVMVQPDKGPKRFVRVQIEKKKNEAK